MYGSHEWTDYEEGRLHVYVHEFAKSGEQIFSVHTKYRRILSCRPYLHLKVKYRNAA